MLDNTEDILRGFAKRVIQQSRTRLTKGKKNSSKELYNSLKYDLKTSANAFILNFFMEEYGIYQDKGVSCLLYTSPSPRDRQKSRMPSSA